MKTRALSTSEMNQLLIAKGYESGIRINLDPNSNTHNADAICFSEFKDGFSNLGYFKFNSYLKTLTRVAKYATMTAAEKKEMQKVIESLPNNTPFLKGPYCFEK